MPTVSATVIVKPRRDLALGWLLLQTWARDLFPRCSQDAVQAPGTLHVRTWPCTCAQVWGLGGQSPRPEGPPSRGHWSGGHVCVVMGGASLRSGGCMPPLPFCCHLTFEGATPVTPTPVASAVLSGRVT